MALEGDYTKKLLGGLRSLPNSQWFKIHGGPMQPAGISDIIGCLRGRFVAIEVKVAGRQTQKNGGLSALQMKFLADVENAGGLAVVVYTSAEVIAVIRQITGRAARDALRL